MARKNSAGRNDGREGDAVVAGQSVAGGVGLEAGIDRRQAHRAAAERGVAHSLLEKTLDRLEDVIDEETAALKSYRATDLRDFNNRKSQALLELSRVARSLGNGPFDVQLTDRLAVLKSKLDANRGVIKMHLDAVREITLLVSDSIQEAESDGTYTRSSRKTQAPT